MTHIYLENFRGLQGIFPLKQVSFLVGENSTGKTSFLKALNILSRPELWFGDSWDFLDQLDFSNYDSISQYPTFAIGILDYKITPKAKEVGIFSIFRYQKVEGTPSLLSFTQLYDNRLINLYFTKKLTRYSDSKINNTFDTEESFISFVKKILPRTRSTRELNHSFPKHFPPRPPVALALSVMDSINKESAELAGASTIEGFSAILPRTTWMAPIRTKPKRYHENRKLPFSPEGEHTPYMLQRALLGSTERDSFTDALCKVGSDSGLFDSIVPRVFGRESNSPFELLVSFETRSFNISDVGYGVSQCLPIITDLLTLSGRSRFLIQQPEVHLHPRAQAALGSFIYQIAISQKRGFCIETHSDFMIDRFRKSLKDSTNKVSSQVLFFERTEKGNSVTPIQIDNNGKYSNEQPENFRSFFLNESLSLLEL